MNTYYKIKLEVTKEQEKAIKELFNQKGWVYKQSGNSKERQSKARTVHPCAPSSKCSSSTVAQQNNAGSECPHCLLSPCVALHNHYWLGNGQDPCDENSVIRKDKYTKFWKAISNLGGWNDPRYLQRKTEEGRGGEWTVTHRREIMPLCVLKRVRQLYPNLPGQPYMGHKWE